MAEFNVHYSKIKGLSKVFFHLFSNKNPDVNVIKNESQRLECNDPFSI